MRTTVTALNVVAFLFVISGLRLVFRQVNEDAHMAERSANVARGIPPPDFEANAKWLMMDTSQQLMLELEAQAAGLQAGISTRQRGVKIAFSGAILILIAAILPLWWS